MKVIQICQRFPPAIGGVESHVSNLALELTRRGVGVKVFTTDSARDIPFQRLPRNNIQYPFEVRRFHAYKAANLPHGLGIIAPSMLPRLLSESFDIVHAHSYGFFPTYAGTFVHEIRNRPLVITTHSDAGRHNLQKLIYDATVPTLTLRRATRIIAITKEEVRYLIRLGVQSKRISVIPNGINLAEFEGKLERPHNSDFLSILFVGRVYPNQKGLETLIRAVSQIARSVNWRLDIVGEDWSGAAGVLELARKLGIHDRVQVLGELSRANLVEAYQTADLFVLPSLFEPFGIVLLEAMASGLPIVASRVGGIPEVVEEGKTGLLVEPGNPEELRKALETLLSDTNLRNRMGQAGRERAVLFSWTTIVPQIQKVYEEVIANDAN
jgi:glycosyltransferase involved in cell wall biosynthesis